MKYRVQTTSTTTRVYIVEAEGRGDIYEQFDDTDGEITNEWNLLDIDDEQEDIYSIREETS